MNRKLFSFLLLLAFNCLFAFTTRAQTSSFSYQGRLTANGAPANGTHTMKFRLYDAETGGNQVGAELTSLITVQNGLFKASLDFGAASFPAGSNRWLEVQVGATTLSPRTPVEATPFAVRALNANDADNAAMLGGVAANQYALKTDTAPNSLLLGGVAPGNYLLKSGGTMTGPLDMGGSKITGLAAPTATTDAANKSYVDSKAGSNYFQKSWSNGSTIGPGAWGTIAASQFTFTTNGGALLIFTDLSLNSGSHVTCRPIIDGAWAGSYGNLTNPGDPFWQEGLQYSGSGNWFGWRKSRIYPNVPPGSHTFALQCATDIGTLGVCNNGIIACSWGVLELK